jgi:hypothetical protein
MKTTVRGGLILFTVATIPSDRLWVLNQAKIHLGSLAALTVVQEKSFQVAYETLLLK